MLCQRGGHEHVSTQARRNELAWRGAIVHFINAQTSAHRVQRRVTIGARPMDTNDAANLMLRQPLAEHPLGEAEYASPSHASGVDCLSKSEWQTRQLKVASGGGKWFAESLLCWLVFLRGWGKGKMSPSYGRGMADNNVVMTGITKSRLLPAEWLNGSLLGVFRPLAQGGARFHHSLIRSRRCQEAISAGSTTLLGVCHIRQSRATHLSFVNG